MEKIILILVLLVIGCQQEQQQLQEYRSRVDNNIVFLDEKTRDNYDFDNAKVKVTVNSSFEHGYLKLHGIIENNFFPLKDVRINVKVFDSTGTVTLSDRNFIPEGGATISPFGKVGYSTIQSVPGEPNRIRYEVEIFAFNRRINLDMKYIK